MAIRPLIVRSLHSVLVHDHFVVVLEGLLLGHLIEQCDLFGVRTEVGAQSFVFAALITEELEFDLRVFSLDRFLYLFEKRFYVVARSSSFELCVRQFKAVSNARWFCLESDVRTR